MVPPVSSHRLTRVFTPLLMSLSYDELLSTVNKSEAHIQARIAIDTPYGFKAYTVLRGDNWSVKSIAIG